MREAKKREDEGTNHGNLVSLVLCEEKSVEKRRKTLMIMYGVARVYVDDELLRSLSLYLARIYADHFFLLLSGSRTAERRTTRLLFFLRKLHLLKRADSLRRRRLRSSSCCRNTPRRRFGIETSHSCVHLAVSLALIHSAISSCSTRYSRTLFTRILRIE